MASCGSRSRDTKLTRLPPALDGHPFPAILTFSAAKVGPAEWLHPAHPLMQEVAEQVLERYRQVLSQGTVLVEDQGQGNGAYLLFYLEQAIEICDSQGGRRPFSKRLQAIEVDAGGQVRPVEGARRYRGLQAGEEVLAQPLRSAVWLQGQEAEEKALDFAVAHTLPAHLDQARQDLQAAKVLDQPAQFLGQGTQPRPLLLPLPPVVVGVALVIPAGALTRMSVQAPAPDAGLWQGVLFPPVGSRLKPGVLVSAPLPEAPVPEEIGPFFSAIPGLIEERRTGASAAWQVVAGERMVPVPPDLQGEWEAHAARLRGLGLEVAGHLPLVVRNAVDGGLAVWIPAGKFSLGSGAGNRDERPAHLLDVQGFYLDVCPVTNAQYAAFVVATGYQPRQWKPTPGGRELAAVNLSWEEARLYAEWAGKRLPTEAEWEKAARGADNRIYPWGNAFDARRASVLGNDYNRVSPVGHFIAGASPYGVLDMAGNVWEWVADWYGADYYGRSPGHNPLGPEQGEHRVLRGGAWICHPRYLRCSQREHQPPSHCSRFIGFRCAQ